MKHKRELIIAGNWKMNKNKEEALKHVDTLINTLNPNSNSQKTILFPPAIYLDSIYNKIKSSEIKLGAQNIYYEEKGAYTGEISASMIKSVGCEYVIIGHSERRSVFQENNDIISRKLNTALKHNIIPILCIGETMYLHSGALKPSKIQFASGI